MTDEKTTGNPVFDYRASFRAKADRVQRVLILGGLALFFVCGMAFLCEWANEHWRLAAALGGLAGLCCCALGIAWGFYWRNRIRREFREHFGTANERR
ncbi:MAG: hypothetical protein ABSE73_04240 [Planctomycetota bacterium]